MSRPTDWDDVFGIDDPAPGDPWSVRGVSTSWGGLADDAEYAESKLRVLMTDDAIIGWIGEGGDAFRDKTGDLPDQLKKCKSSYRIASEALGWWAGKLETHQSDADAALVKGRAAKSDLESAQGRLASADSSVTGASGSDVLALSTRYADTPAPAGVNMPSSTDVQAAQNRLKAAKASQASASSAVSTAESALSAAKQLALDAAELRIGDGKTAAGKIHDASDARIEERSWWDKLKDWVAEAWDIIIKVCKIVVLVLGVVALILGGPLAWVVLAAAILVLADTLMKYAKGQASLLDVALASLDCIPGAKGLTSLAKLGKLAKAGKAGLKTMVAGLREGKGATTILTAGRNVATFKSVKGVTHSFEANIKEAFQVVRTADEKAATTAVGKLGVEGDQGGHYVAHRYVPGAERPNLFPQNGNFNTSAYKRMENEWGDWVDNGMEINAKGVSHPPGAVRPDSVSVKYDVVNPATGEVVHRISRDFLNEAGQVFDRVDLTDIKTIIAGL